MKTTITTLATIIALVLVVCGFITGVYPQHDHAFSEYLLIWALVVVWLGGVLSSRFPPP